MMYTHTSVGLFTLLLLLGVALGQPFNNITGEECTTNSDCASNEICADLKCVDPCSGLCGNNTVCVVQDLLPVCSCKSGYDGDPFTECKPVNAECTESSQCSMDKACINQRCIDPCQGACGVNTVCRVANHRPMCACLKGFVFSPQAGCKPVLIPDCLMNHHCPEDRACRQQKCVDPCDEAGCGNNTVCNVKNHFPICACKPGFSGDALHECVPVYSTEAAGKNSKPSNKKSFYISDDLMSWMDAVSECHSRGMYLATINNEEEWNELVEAYGSKRRTDTRFWLGAHDLGNYRQFVWISTGKQLSFSNWQSGEPSNSDMHCIVVYYNFFWVSENCVNNYYYACESI